MKVYREMAKHPVFSIEDVKKISGNTKTAYSQLRSMIKKGLVRKIRSNAYSVVNPASGQIMANRYQIACSINEDAYISHHSAFEYYGFANQVFYEVYVSSKSKFQAFEYDHLIYRFIASRMNEGVIEAKNIQNVRITDIERTVIDSIHDLNKVGGLEELLKCIDAVYYLDEQKLRFYLDIYDIQGLYQKTGYILSRFAVDLKIPNEFFDYCKLKVGKSRRYLVSNNKMNSFYDREWKLMVPKALMSYGKQGGDELV